MPNDNRMHRSASVFWFTGMSGAGKSSIAEAAASIFRADGLSVLILDGDAIRESRDVPLGFTEDDIKLNNELIAEACNAHRHEADIILVPIISPYAESRAKARALLSPGFFEVFVNTPVQVLESRDTKGLYAKAQRGDIDNLIGYSPGSRYEPPEAADFQIKAGTDRLAASVECFVQFVREMTIPGHEGS